MYSPRTHSEDRPEVLAEFITANLFATLVSAGPSGELWATHLPLLFDPTVGEYGRIEGHLARANPHHRLVRATAESANRDSESLVIFNGPNAYISPSWYPTKARHGREVPTWNYIAVHAYGSLTLREDPGWLLAHVTRLSEQHEASREAPWAVSDAPADHIERELKAIVGFEMEVTRVDARWKMSQNHPAENIDGVVAGLGGSEREMDRAVASIVEERRPDRS